MEQGNQGDHGGEHPGGDELDLLEIFAAFWAGKWLILLLGIGCGLVGAVYAFLSPNIYTSEALLVEKNSDNRSVIPAQLGGLATMAGISLGSGETSKKIVALETIKSHVFLTNFIHQHDIKPALFAVSGWLPESDTDQLRWDTGIYNPATGQWQWQDGIDAPTDLEAVEEFRSILIVKDNSDTGMVRLGVKFLAPRLAKEWASLLVSDLNAYMKRRDMEQTKKNLEYLQKQLEKTPVTNMQQVFYSLIEEQTKSLMLAEVQDEFVFRIIDPPIMPERPSGPKRVLIILLAGLFGGMLSLMIIFVRFSFNRDRAS